MGEITTFYSFKGGTGRTMALANIAILTAQEAEGPVLMIDWDLEAPGLEQYFKPYISDNDVKEGILEMVELAKKTLPKMSFGKEDKEVLESFFKQQVEIILNQILLSGKDKKLNLFLIKAGKNDDNYAKRVSRFNWSAFYKKIPGFFPFFANYLSQHFSHVFIDSRTGHTDIGGVCTMSMPEKLVLVFTPNEQSLAGTLALASKAADYRMKFDNFMRPLLIYPLPSRVDFNGVSVDKRKFWQSSYELRWETVFQEIYNLPATISLKNYFEKAYIRHDSNYAFGEDLAVLEDDEGPESPAQDFKRFATLLSFDEIWENQPFANLETPFELVFVFAETEKNYVDSFAKQLSIYRHQNIVRWSTDEYLPVNYWDEVLERKIASGSADVTLVFISKELMAYEEKWKPAVGEAIRQQKVTHSFLVIPILIDEVPLNRLFSESPIFPGRSKPLTRWSDEDEAWTQISKQFRRELTKLNELRHTHEKRTK